MLSAESRLRHSLDIAEVIRHGRKAASGPVVLHATFSGSGPTQVAFAVGRKVGNSVVRHRVTRQLRHVVRGEFASIPTGSRLVVRALESAATSDYARLQKAFRTALARLAPEA